MYYIPGNERMDYDVAAERAEIAAEREAEMAELAAEHYGDEDPATYLTPLDFTTDDLSHEDALIAAWEEVNAATNRATAEHMGGVWDWN
jgi:hypothetical protein